MSLLRDKVSGLKDHLTSGLVNWFIKGVEDLCEMTFA